MTLWVFAFAFAHSSHSRRARPEFVERSPMPMAALSRRLLNTREAADYIGLSKSSLDKWRVAGAPPRFMKIGRAIRYDRAVLDAYLQSCERCSTSEDSSGGAQ
jgi:predicted DNA-binding transcriptional regulator AlpA